MWIVAAILTMFCFGINNLIIKASTGRRISKVHMQFFFYLIAFLLMVGYGMIKGFASFNLLTIVLGTAIGILNANGNIQMTKAYEKGPASLTSPIINTYTVIPILSAAFIFHEQITLIQWIGIIVMLASAVVIQYSPGSTGTIDYMPWMYRILLAILSFGILGVLMKTSSQLQINSMNTLVCMYGGGVVYLWIQSLMTRENWNRSELKFGAVVGFFSVIGYSSYFFSLDTGIASIVFPIVSLSSLVVVVGSILLYKEKLKVYQIIGVLSAIAGIVMTKI